MQSFSFSVWCRVGNKSQECGEITVKVQTRNNDLLLSGWWIWASICQWLIDFHVHFPGLTRELATAISSFDPHFRKSQIIVFFFFCHVTDKAHGSQHIISDEVLMTEGEEKERGKAMSSKLFRQVNAAIYLDHALWERWEEYWLVWFTADGPGLCLKGRQRHRDRAATASDLS